MCLCLGIPHCSARESGSHTRDLMDARIITKRLSKKQKTDRTDATHTGGIVEKNRDVDKHVWMRRYLLEQIERSARRGFEIRNIRPAMMFIYELEHVSELLASKNTFLGM